MSYILEALKKSQQQRELGAVPTLSSQQSVAERPGPPASPWPGLALVLATIAIGVALWAGLRPLPTAQPQAPSRTPAASGAGPLPANPRQEGAPQPGGAASQGDPGVVGRPDTTPGGPAPTRPPAPSHINDVTPAARPPSGAVAPLRPMPLKPEQPPAPEESTGSSRNPGTAERQNGDPHPRHDPLPAPPARLAATTRTQEQPASDGDNGATRSEEAPEQSDVVIAEPLLSELPEEIRSEMPPLAINVHVYASNPSGRFVLINLRKRREGETVEAGIRLERIVPQGVVLRYRDHSFLLLR